MSTLHEQLYEQQPPSGDLSAAVQGQVASPAPAVPGDDLYVTVPSVDGGAQHWGPCAWSPSNAVPDEGDDVLVIFDETETPWVIVLAPTPTGGAGTGDLSYTHTQVAVSATWNVAHNLGKYPSVSVVDSGGTELLVGVVYVDVNNLTLSFGAPTSGKAYVN